ncbi:MAG: hypothetical protein H7122_09090 [Chitinophagaceae bacterium]|nr:hypothetical protein [Chitinophagaceae bacterium]
MEIISNIGRYLFAVAITGFGMIQFITADFPTAFLPVPVSLPARILFVQLTTVIFLLTGISIVVNKWTEISTLVTGSIFLLFFFFLLLPRLLSDIRDPTEWTICSEALAIGSGSIILAGIPSIDFFDSHKKNVFRRIMVRASRYCFAISLAVFGIQHMMYSDFIVTLMPSWMPAKKFWSYIIQFALPATALSIFINIGLRLAAVLSGCMFLLWVVLLHIPRAIMSPDKETEWTSLFIALAMAGICFLLSRRFNAVVKIVNLNTINDEAITVQ